MNEEPCTKLGPELSGYHDGMLDEATRLKVEAHLESCAACRARLADYARVDRAVHALGAPLFEDRLREDLVAYARATIADRGRGARRPRWMPELRSWRTYVPLAAAAGVAVLVLKLADGGFQSLSARRQPPPSATFESQVKSGVEADSQAGARAFGSGTPATAPEALSAPRDRSATSGGEIATAPVPDADRALSAPADRRSAVRSDEREEGGAESRLADESAIGEQAQAPPAADTFKEPATWGGVEAQSTPPPPPLAKEEPEKASEAPPPVAVEAVPQATSPTQGILREKDQGHLTYAQSSPSPAPQPAAARGHLDPEAALSIATLALQVGDLLGARLALQDLPTLPADSLTARAAVLALTLAERSQDLADCRAARERADALVEAVPSGALADTLRVRRAALPCPH